MPEIQDDDDDAFGDFECISFSPVNSHSNPIAAEEDEWGDFVDNTLQFQRQSPPNSCSLDLFSGLQMPNMSDPQPMTVSQLQPRGHELKSPLAAEKRWEKPQGAIPLSIFGEEETEEPEKVDPGKVDLSPFSGNGFSATHATSTKNVVVSSSSVGAGLNDFIMNLYGRDEQIVTENVVVDGSDDFDNAGWEFKDASLESRQGRSSSNKDRKVSEISDVQAKTAAEAEATTPITAAAGQVTQNGSRIENLSDQNMSSVENWEFKDALSGGGSIDFFSEEKVKEQKISEFFGAQANAIGMQGIGEVEHNSPHPFSNGKLNYGDKFDNQDGVFHGPTTFVSNGLHGLNSGSDDAFGDLISNIYTQAEKTSTMSSMQQQPTESKLSSPLIVLNSNDDLDEDGWEFRDAFSEGKVENGNPESKTSDAHRNFSAISNLYSQAEQTSTVNSTQLQQSENELNSSQIGPNYDDDLNEDHWEFRDASLDDKFENGPEAKTLDSQRTFSAISNLCCQAEQTLTVNYTQQQPTENQLRSSQMGPDYNDDLNEDGWEFRDAFSGGKFENGNPKSKTSDAYRNFSSGYLENEFSSSQLVQNLSLVNGNDDIDEDGWEFKDAFSKGNDENGNHGHEASDAHQNFSTNTKLKDFIGFYSRLKDEARFFVLHHLDDLKNAMEVVALSCEEPKFMALDKEIQVAYEKVREEKSFSGKVYPEEHPPINFCVQELLGAVRDPSLQALETEYHLSKRISSAETDLSSAVGLLEHATSMSLVLTLASEEEQSSYISSWTKMVSACAQELKHGAMIWKQLVEKNIHIQVLSKPQGLQYFVALGEIYRVAQVLRVSVSFYKPWILLKSMDSTTIFQLLEDCSISWEGSGLQESLERVLDLADHEHKIMIGALLQSIKSIHDLEEFSLLEHVSGQDESFCKLSLLPSRLIQEMKVVIWNGEHYFLKLANLWANQISCDPPLLPRIHMCQ